MKRMLSAALGLAILTGASLAQGSDQADLQAKYEAKLEKEFVSKIAWTQDLSEAQKKAKESGKLILGYFTRSYAP
ncbi:MAG: hypothetical protein WD226_09375 [Planctomycetota bacterium]